MPPPSTRPPFLTRHGVVPLYVPNLIGEVVDGRRGRRVGRVCSCSVLTVCVGRQGGAAGGGGRRPFFFFRRRTRAKKRRHSHPRASSPTTTGYARIACAAYAFSVALTNPVQCIVFYFIG